MPLRNVLTIFKKEWDRVFKDKRLLISVMILPGLMIFLIYTFIGSAISNLSSPEEERVAFANVPTAFNELWNEQETTDSVVTISVDVDQLPEYQALIDGSEWDLIVVFPADFETSLGVVKPEVTVYYNPNENVSSGVFQRFQGYLLQYQAIITQDLYGDTESFSVAWEATPVNNNVLVGNMMAMLLPMLVVMFLFSGAMSIGPESIAGEKERGTIATLLVTPVKRREIALGKILALGVLSLLSAVSSFIGIITSLPNLYGLDGVNTNIYGITDYLMILALLFSTVFVIVGVIAIVSAYAKNLKEAGTLIMPIYLVTIIVGISSIFGDGANPSFWFYLIPIYNTVQTLTAILTFDPTTVAYLLITIAANIVYMVIFVQILNRMFNSERIMFAK